MQNDKDVYVQQGNTCAILAVHSFPVEKEIERVRLTSQKNLP
jgi:hypothetical protein